MIEIKNKNTGIVIFSCEGNSLQNVNLKGADLQCADLKEANLRRADLQWANLQGANLKEANLKEANLKGANLKGANLKWADLKGANLKEANLQCADLKEANLKWADLKWANLKEANLQGADLKEANLKGSDLQYVKTNYLTIGYHLACPEIGEFIAYKKCRNNIIVTLKILKDSKRSSATTLKCRASKVEVLSISNGDIANSIHETNFTYKVGQIIEVKDFDDDRWNECSKGIHFFMNESAALSYEA